MNPVRAYSPLRMSNKLRHRLLTLDIDVELSYVLRQAPLAQDRTHPKPAHLARPGWPRISSALMRSPILALLLGFCRAPFAAGQAKPVWARFSPLPKGFNPGDQFPSVSLPSAVDGRAVSLASFR